MELLTPVSRQNESTREQLYYNTKRKSQQESSYITIPRESRTHQTKDYEIGFIVVVAAVPVITLVLISFVTPTVTVAAQIVSYLFPQSVDAGFIPLSIEEDSDTSRKQSQQSSGSLRESATGTQPCDPEATICIVGPERPGTEGKTEKPERQERFNSDVLRESSNDQIIKGEQDTDEQQEDGDGIEERVEIDKKAPVIISGDNAYIVWFNDQNIPNNNSEVLFRSSADGGVTFADKINLSNTTAADYIAAEIAADGSNVIITWWEHNATSEEPVVRVSTDSGATFGPLLRLATNGTICG